MLPFLLVTSAVVLLTSAAERPPVVTLRHGGAVRGQYEHSAEGRQFAAFRGIPYAQPPVGDLRFRAPRAHQGWSGGRDATHHGSVCLQVNIMLNSSIRGEEDCLYLNVYTPHLPTEEGPVSSLDAAVGLPVMVWIHGGAFYLGSGDDDMYGVDYLMQEDVVVVTLNYRVSIFGFLSTGDAAAPGNYGLLDQVMALRWVRENIGQFGGNPQLVTVFGESAGGASVSLQVVSPLARGLFHRAISQSGAAAAPWALAEEPQLQLARHYAEQLQCPTDATDAIVACLRRAPTEDIMRVQRQLGFALHKGNIYFKPCVDAPAESPFLPEHPNALLSRGEFSLVPWMAGVARTEGVIMLRFVMQDEPNLPSLLSGNDEIWSSDSLIRGARLRDADPRKSGKLIKDFFQSSGPLSGENLSPLIEVLGDWNFNLPFLLETEMASRLTPVYTYVLDHTGPGRLTVSDLAAFPAGPDLGVTHGDDLAYLFKGGRQRPASVSSPQYQMIRLLVSLWTSFARLGYPSSEVFSMPDWPISSPASPTYVRLNSQPSVSSGLFQDRLQFWKSLLDVDRWNSTKQKQNTARDEL